MQFWHPNPALGAANAPSHRAVASNGADKRRAMQETGKAVDRIQQRIADYASGLNYTALSAEAIQTAKARLIDTLGALVGGFFSEPSSIARNTAMRMPNADGA